MSGTSPRPSWDVDYDRRLAVCCYVVDDYVNLLAFGPLESGVLDLVAVRVEPDGAHGADGLQRLVEAWDVGRPRSGLTTKQIRALAAHGLLARARQELDLVVRFSLPASVKTRARAGPEPRPALFYARVAARYATLLDGPGGARRRLADELHVSEDRVRDLINEARRKGLWEPLGHGKRGGQLTDKATALIAEEDDRGKR